MQCKGYTKGRALGPPLWIVFHDMEASELPNRAESLAQYGATVPDGRQVSWHYAADSDSVVQCVRLADTAWTVGNVGNQLGINWEFAGFAAQNRDQWLDAYGVAMLDKAIPIMVRDMRTYGIPARWLTDAEVKAKQKGLTTHDQLRRCFGGTTHTDPGKYFPADYVLDLIRQHLNGADGVTPAQEKQLLDSVGHVESMINYNTNPWILDLGNRLSGLAANTASSDAIAAKLASNPAFITSLAKAIVVEFKQ